MEVKAEENYCTSPTKSIDITEKSFEFDDKPNENSAIQIEHEISLEPSNKVDSNASVLFAKNTYEVLKGLFFRKYSVRFIDSDNDKENFVSVSKSILRLQWIGLILGTLLALIATIFVSLVIYNRNGELPIIYTPEVSNQNAQLGISIPHIALIYDDGSVYDVSTQPDISSSRGVLVKLPKSKSYFGYSDEFGSLYFINGDSSKSITQYNKALFSNGHHILERSKNHLIPNDQYISNGIRVGDKFWVWGNKDQNVLKGLNDIAVSCDNEDLDACKGTSIWYIKKKQWRRGPKIPKYLYEPWAATSLNRTAIIFVGRFDRPEDKSNLIDASKNSEDAFINETTPPFMSLIKEYTAVFDFENNIWQEYPSIFKDFPSNMVVSYSLACQFGKRTKSIYAYIHSWDINFENYITLHSYDMSTGSYEKWETLSHQKFSSIPNDVKMFVVGGLFYFTNNPLDNIENQNIQAEIQDGNGMPHYLVNAVSYLVYK